MEGKLLEKEINLGRCDIIEIPAKTIVSEHKESRAKYTAFGFAFPDGYPGTLVITKGTKSQWLPKKDIKRIIIEWE